MKIPVGYQLVFDWAVLISEPEAEWQLITEETVAVRWDSLINSFDPISGVHWQDAGDHERQRWIRTSRYNGDPQTLILVRSTTLPLTAQKRKHSGGRPAAADWAEIEKSVAREIDAVGFPTPDHEAGWRSLADVIRFVETILGSATPGHSTLKRQVSAMLQRINSKARNSS